MEDLKKKVWKISKLPLFEWKKRIVKVIKNNSSAINDHIKVLSILYKEPIPTNILVSLHYYPLPGRHKGEPINNFKEIGKLDRKFADILYWVSSPSILATDSKSDIEKIYREYTENIVLSILHEVQHASFQREKFEKLIKKAEKDKIVKRILMKLENKRETYIEATNETITTYINSYAEKEYHKIESKNGNINTPLKIEVDEEKVKKIFGLTIKEDIERWDKKGPYTELRQAWEKALGGLPQKYARTKNEVLTISEKSDISFSGKQIYEIAQQLDTKLSERYVKANRQIDTKFIVELYKKVDEHLSITSH